MAKQPGDRFAQAGAFAVALASALADAPADRRPKSRPGPDREALLVQPAMSYFPSVRRLIITGLTAVLVLTATGGALGARAAEEEKAQGVGRSASRRAASAPGPGGRQIVTIRRQHLEMTSDGVVFMRATCDRRQACVGAILLDADSGPELGRSDLRISGRTTATVGVSLSAREGPVCAQTRRRPLGRRDRAHRPGSRLRQRAADGFELVSRVGNS